MKKINSITITHDAAGYPTVRIETARAYESKPEVRTFHVDDDLMKDVARLCVQRECVVLPWEDIEKAALKD